MPRSLPGPCTGFSLTSTSPLSARPRPAISRRRVDLPHPEGPSRTRNSPMSRPSREYASSISKLMFSSASTFPPSDDTNDRLTLRTVIFDFLGSMFGRLQVRGGTGNGRSASGKSGTRFAPGKEAAFQKAQKKTEQECGNANGDDSRINALEIQNFARGFHHVADAFARVDHLGEDHVSPADVVENAERRKDRRDRRAEHQPQDLSLIGAECVGGFQQRVVNAIRFFHHHRQQIE